MKKNLLLAAALVATATASAQNYSAQAYTSADPYWDATASYDGHINVDGPITVDVYDDYVIINQFLGEGSVDLKVSFDEDENVTSVTPIISGVEGDAVTSGYCAFSTGSADYYYVQLYIGESYDYAWADDASGYVTLSGYFYSDSSTYTWNYYNLTWGELDDEEIELGELKYSCDAKTGVYEDWGAPDAFFAPGTPVKVNVYENGVQIDNWCGASDNAIIVQADDDANVTAIGTISGEYTDVAHTGSYVSTYTGNNELYYASIYIVEGSDCAYFDDKGGYVLLTVTFYDSENNDHQLYYYVEWTKDENGITDVNTVCAPAEYFNLQGMRIQNPAPGQIVIARQGSKVSKVIK